MYVSIYGEREGSVSAFLLPSIDKRLHSCYVHCTSVRLYFERTKLGRLVMASIKHSLRHHFIPHEGNNYHPHILHRKRAVFYGVFCVALKAFVIAFAVMLPTEAFLAPDVLQGQAKKIIAMTNSVRAEQGLPALDQNVLLIGSADLKAEDMNEHQYFSHVSPDHHGLSYFLGKVGYRYKTAGENLAMGFSDAESVVDAWMKSPTHYANLVDKDFQQFGIGLIAGTYEGQPTVFVAQHFGTPSSIAAQPPVAQKPVATSTVPTVVAVHAVTTTAPMQQPAKKPTIPSKPAPTVVSSTPIVAVVPPTQAVTSTMPDAGAEAATSSLAGIGGASPSDSGNGTESVDPSQSFVAWSDLSNHETLLHAEVRIAGNVKRASVTTNGYTIPLKKEEDGVYRGELTARTTPKELFHVVVSPTVNIEWANTGSTEEAVPWKNPQIVSQTPWERYIQANSWLSASIPLFSVVKGIYWFALIFFAFALGLNIFIEIKKQHPHVIAQTVGLLGLIALMIWK
jgi:uncharacterized protein YkwD